MVSEREKHGIIDFENPVRARTECGEQCKIMLNGEIKEKVN